MIEAAACDLSDMLLHRQFTVQLDSEVTYNTDWMNRTRVKMQCQIVLSCFLQQLVKSNQISSVDVALSWSLLDEHQLATSDIQSWSTHLAYSGTTKPHEQVCADENMLRYMLGLHMPIGKDLLNSVIFVELWTSMNFPETM